MNGYSEGEEVDIKNSCKGFESRTNRSWGIEGILGGSGIDSVDP